ncbi:DUF3768 domain-containing protein [Mesorhizobium escarrei]|uniref:DUF3768 domain-containing protein n=1 Tax=Mesorhizobium escarrei TaxID=666018 RepID=A0ABM9E1J3_9HYPH|nr:DUF3768 domain-containing protein [Mesorhizobium escarrei]CAH2402379.1 conserved hypothetical protein [Mesorhizobium escarrei]
MTCSTECVDRTTAAEKRTRVRTLNDQLRQTGTGGRVVLTAGIAALSAKDIADILMAVANFDAFDGDNDPWGEHDCALLHVGDWQLFWKVDYYDRTLSNLSPNPADPAVTIRIMTVMLAEEY